MQSAPKDPNDIEIPSEMNGYDIKGSLNSGINSELFMVCIKDEFLSIAQNSSSSSTYTKKNKCLYALKKIDLAYTSFNINEIMNEEKIMKQCRHKNIVRYFGTFLEGSSICIVMELCTASVDDVVQTRYSSMSGQKPTPVMKASEIASIIKQVLNGLAYLYGDGFIHRDIKPANILITNEGVIKIADFGVSGFLNVLTVRRDSRNTFVGTPCYIAPEVIEGLEYNFSADIWSLGITCIEMAAGRAPYCHYKPIEILSEILKSPSPSLGMCALSDNQFKKYPKSFTKFLDLCLIKEQNLRPGPDELLNHDFITQNSKGQSFILSSVLESKAGNFLREKLSQNEKNENYSQDLSDIDERYSNKLSVADILDDNEENDKSEEHNKTWDKKNLVMRIRNLNDNSLNDVDFCVKKDDSVKEWVKDMIEGGLIKQEHSLTVTNALSLILENDLEEITFKLDKNHDPKTLNKTKFIGYAQFKVNNPD
ncbi:MAG: STE20/SPS1-related proline-alanine-rich protein kinase [Paramarteilia canceri]